MSCENNNPVVGIIMGSESDMPAMEPCMKQLDEFGIPYEVKVASAHRKPAEVHEWASTAHERGIRVIVAAAGKAAHLGGVVAAYTPNPVITVPMKTSDLGGLDSLLSMVQMPSGVPVATVALNAARRSSNWRAAPRSAMPAGPIPVAAMMSLTASAAPTILRRSSPSSRPATAVSTASASRTGPISSPACRHRRRGQTINPSAPATAARLSFSSPIATPRAPSHGCGRSPSPSREP